MRIPSQFNQDNLYQRRNPHPQGPGSLRHLVRLVVVLALVVAVMYQARKPAIYEPFFGEHLESVSVENPNANGSPNPQGDPSTTGNRVVSEPSNGPGQQANNPPDRGTVTNQDSAETPLGPVPTPTRSGSSQGIQPRRRFVESLVASQTGSAAIGPNRPSNPNRAETDSVQHLADELVSTLTPNQQLALLAYLVKTDQELHAGEPKSNPHEHAVDGRDTAPSESVTIAAVISDLIEQVSQSKSLDDQSRRDWTRVLLSLERDPDGDIGSNRDNVVFDTDKVDALVRGLDRAVTDRVVDGSVWRSNDSAAFYWFLFQADVFPSRGAATTGVLPLLQQPDVFRNQLVRVKGAVMRMDRRQAQPNPFAITQYWELWIRPDGGADRPVLAIAPRIPPSIKHAVSVMTGSTSATSRSDPSEETIYFKGDGIPVVFVGRYLKRLAYRSSAGADLAPVVVGRVTATIPHPSSAATTSTRSFDQRFWVLVAVVAISGIGIAMLIMWRTAIAGQRLRKIRHHDHESDPTFLHQLSVSDDDDSPYEPLSERTS